ncbi:amino acid ABC transporter permease [Carboxydothermus hydrogenoformans]|uniref:Glutamine ABC transporter, permease protein n=1 Tax=Carboxydothermus hydrogenoformans (strain ATCC BAA-161 / DSM 6008 / Z-2901) TaxID=246194 RepID=Q3AES1_CARHZ|nr:amino acid ABC transporter permease [Carboxydothermus hydrogenoformans]ABB15190.1 glutamine ABC transporter, permease protein [Carboxydothermus hydrogenoformans Z-2901]
MELKWSVVIESLPLLAEGALVTLKITVIAVTLGSIIGLFAGLMRIARNPLLKFIARVYVDFIRGTPLLVQIFIIYYGFPQLWAALTGGQPHAISPWAAAIASTSINSGAYVAEIFRAGIQSIDRGQMEAARSLGMTYGQAMRYVILPQAFKRVIPPLGNEFIAMLKDTSLLSVIGFEELARRGALIIGYNARAFEVWFAVAILYLIMTLLISQLVSYTERRLKTGDHH